MPKSDKELAAEITQTFIQSWNARSTTKVLTVEQVSDILAAIYNTLNEFDFPKE